MSSLPSQYSCISKLILCVCSKLAIPRFTSMLSTHAPSAAEILSSRRERHRDLTQFSRRRRTVFKKVDDLHRDCQADVFLMVRREGKVYAYISKEDADWPPSEECLVSGPHSTCAILCLNCNRARVGLHLNSSGRGQWWKKSGVVGIKEVLRSRRAVSTASLAMKWR